MKSLSTRIHDYLKKHQHRAFTATEVARALKIKMAQRRQLRSELHEMALGGLVTRRRGSRYQWAPPQAEAILDSDQFQKKAEKNLASMVNDIIDDLKLPTLFPKDVGAEASKLTDEISKEEIRKRRDLRGHIIVTIDGANARDFDDAISVEDIGRDKIRLRVSIADVSHYVAMGSPIDREALARATSIYFPMRVLPMLPENLSNNVCSLVPGKDRLAFTVEMDFDSKGTLLRSDFYKSVIKSSYRLTYHQVARALIDKDPDVRHEIRHVLPHLELQEKLFLRLRQSRLRRGSLDFDLPEPEIVMDLEESRVDTIIKAERTRAHMMIEEFMISANEAVARYITDQGVPMIYRVHDEPAREKLKELQSSLHNLGYSLKIAKKKMDPKPLAAVIQQSQGKAEGRMVNTLTLRTLAKAIYSVENVGHFGLASQCYTHFTSPIRRYPDLVTHRILATLLETPSGQEPRVRRSRNKPQMQRQAMDVRRLSRMAEHCSLRERLAMEAEWAMRDLLVSLFMEDHVDAEFSGIISGVTAFGFFVELTKYFVEGLVHIRTLEGDYYRFSSSTHSLIGRRSKRRFRIGDPVRVRVSRVNVEKRWVDLVLVQD